MLDKKDELDQRPPGKITEGMTLPPDYRLVQRISDLPGESWQARDGATGQLVLVRFFPQLDPDSWQVAREAMTLARGMVHQNLVRLLGMSSPEDQSLAGMPWLVEPWLEDALPFNLAGKSKDEIGQLLAQLVDLIIYAHESGIVHGHLNPGSMLVQQGSLKVRGFGAAASDGEDGQAAFLSPEARQGKAPDKSDDIYSLGAIIFWCLTGHSPPEDTESAGTELNGLLPPQLDPIVRQMMSRASWDRQVNLPELAEHLQVHFGAGHQALPEVAFTRSDEAPKPDIGPAGPATTGASQSSTQPASPRQASKISLPWVYAGLALLLVVAIGVINVLPEQVILTEPSASPTANRVKELPRGPTPIEQARLKILQEESQTVAEQILRLQLELEDAAANIWASNELAAVSDELNQAEDLFSRGEFALALEIYNRLQKQLLALKQQSSEVLDKNLQLGDQALAQGDPETALAAWTIVTAIAPENPDYSAKLTSAENLPEAIALANRALMNEREGELEAALESYRQASSLTDDWPVAAEGVERVAAAITQRQFTDAMSAGFVALSSKDYEAATADFAQAALILPDSTEPEDALLQVEQSQRADLIAGYQTAAETALADERWQDAIDSYDKALAMDNSLVFANDGLATARMRQDLETRLQRILADPASLQEDETLAEARQLLAEASRLEQQNENTRGMINGLAEVISTARIPFPLTIISDGQTQVIVYKVGNLGTLGRHQLELIPGRYTIIGKRAGYRDVRHDLVLSPGRTLAPITVACNERI